MRCALTAISALLLAHMASAGIEKLTCEEWDPATAKVATSWNDIMLEVKDLTQLGQHRSFQRIGQVMKLCMAAMLKSFTDLPYVQVTHESESVRARTCERSVSWADRRWPAAEALGELPGAMDGPVPSHSVMLKDDQKVLFVVMAFVPNCGNAHLLDVSIGSVAAFHPGADILVVDNDSPRADLVEAVVKSRRAVLNATISLVRSSVAHPPPLPQEEFDKIIKERILNKDNSKFAHLVKWVKPLYDKEIGGLRAAVAFVEARALSAAGKPPPALVVALPHSTGLRLPLPLPEMMEKLASATCAAFALDVPWYRYEDNPAYRDARYGSPVSSFNFFDLNGQMPIQFSKESKPNELWSANTHGTMAMPWDYLHGSLRHLGLLSDVVRDDCSTFACCCFEQLSGTVFDWLAPGNSQWRETYAAAVHTFMEDVIADEAALAESAVPLKPLPHDQGDVAEIEKGRSKGFQNAWKPSSDALPVQNYSGTLRDLRCIIPVLWKVHGGTTHQGEYDGDPDAPKDGAEDGVLQSTKRIISERTREHARDSPEVRYWKGFSDVVPESFSQKITDFGA